VSRVDISPDLVHFTSGENQEDAFRRLQKIIAERRLIAGRQYIKGNYACVCFSEAPLTILAGGLVNEEYYSRYSPFGIMVSKRWLFAQGGRPVIYESDQEYNDLPETHRWRHVLYELREDEGFFRVDFTWEREWRIRCDHLRFDEASAQIVVPNHKWAERLVGEHHQKEDDFVAQYRELIGEDIAEQYREEFRWTIHMLTEVPR
jgi:hypothetical protein